MSANNTFTVDTRHLRAAVEKLDHPNVERIALPIIRKAARAAVRIVRNTARRELGSHRQTGKMRGRIRTKFWGRGWQFAAGVKSTGPQTNLIVGGVRPHEITSGGRLMPMWAGRGKGRGIEGFARYVGDHPGFAGDPFFKRAIDVTEPKVQQLLDAAVTDIARAVAQSI